VKLLLIAALALAFAAPALASEQHPTQSELEGMLVCPACHEPLDESSSPIAQQMKSYIRKHIAMGWTRSRIINTLEGPPNNLGISILGVPQHHGFDLLAWWLPIGGAVLGGVALGGGAWAWSRNRSDDDPLPAGPALDPVLERRVDEALAGFDG
jgi:cytochrome c-type biogenesis protein CcmH/NrfF